MFRHIQRMLALILPSRARGLSLVGLQCLNQLTAITHNIGYPACMSKVPYTQICVPEKDRETFRSFTTSYFRLNKFHL